MNEDNNIPNIPRPTREMPDLIKNIKLFAGSRASAIEAVIQEKDIIIENKNQEIINLTETVQRIREESSASQMRFLKEKKKLISSFRTEIAKNEQTIVGMDRTIIQLKEDNALLERSLIQETKEDMKGMFTSEKAIQAIVPPVVEVDPAYREFKRYPVYPVPFYSEQFSLSLKDEFHLDDGRIVQQSEGYVQVGGDLVAADDVETRIRRFNGYFIDNNNLKAQVQATYYPPNHPLNGFKPAGEIIYDNKFVISTHDLNRGYTCIGYGCVCACTLFCCLR